MYKKQLKLLFQITLNEIPDRIVYNNYKSDYEKLSPERSKVVPIFSSRGFLYTEQLQSELAMYLTIFIRTLNNKDLKQGNWTVQRQDFCLRKMFKGKG